MVFPLTLELLILLPVHSPSAHVLQDLCSVIAIVIH